MHDLSTIGHASICRRAVLSIEVKLGQDASDEETNSEGNDLSLHGYVKKMNMLRDDLLSTAKKNTDDAQMKQKRDYDKKHVIGKKVIIVIACKACKRMHGKASLCITNCTLAESET